MASTRFCRPDDNKVLRYTSTDTFPRIINGDSTNYTTPPAKVEDPQYPMSNIHNPDRYTPWATPAGTTPLAMKLHIDAGSNISVGFVGLFGVRWLAGVAFSVPITVGYRTAAQGYASAGPFTGVVTSSFGTRRDTGFVLGAPVSGRYWEFNFTTMIAGGISFGGIYLGAISQDLGILYSPGMEDNVIFSAIESRTGAGHLNVMTVGDPRHLISMPFVDQVDAVRTKIDAVFGETSKRDPVVWIDRNDVASQVVLAKNSLRWRHNWDSPNLWDTDLELEVLG